MDQKQLNETLIQKKILSQDKVEALQKDKSQQKTVESWEDFLIGKKILTEDQLLAIKSQISAENSYGLGE